MSDEGPAWVIERQGVRDDGRRWYQIRKRGGQSVRVVVQDIFADEEDQLLAIRSAVLSLPDPPSYWAV